MDITSMPALALGKMIKEKKISAVEITKEQLKVIKQRETLYHSYITVTEEEALAQAADIQKRIDRGELEDSPLAGVPMAVKDNICTKGIKTTCASRMLSNFEPSYDATVVERLKQAGAIILGKTNMDEFAMGGTTEKSYFGPSKNPWNIDHVPGGSSGGSASVVAAEEATYALGTDTGGSIRQPSSYCGITGIKPTYGTISRYGLIAYASSLDQIGPMGRNVSDCAAILELIAGQDPMDSTSLVLQEKDYRKALVDDVKGMRIGIPKAYLRDGVDDEVFECIQNAVKIFRQKGAIVEEFELENVDYAVPAYYVIACAEASSNLSRFDGIKYGYQTSQFEDIQDLYQKSRSEGLGSEVKRRIMIGTFVLSSENYDKFYMKALKVRSLINQSFLKAFDQYDLILGPTSLRTAPKLGEKASSILESYRSDINTVSVNLAGLPAMSLPCGIAKNGLPIGLQLIGKHFGEKDIIRAAYSFEQTIGYARPTTLLKGLEAPILQQKSHHSTSEGGVKGKEAFL
jgi:aspartyl-tRNA(Asn)/glutamyl-tRNA(Gln) amidotransferase subunit A